MADQRPATVPDPRQVQASEVSPSERRRRAHEILSNQRSQLDRFEHELSERLRHLAEELTRDLASNQGQQFSAGQQAAEDAAIAPLRQQLAAREAELAAGRAELDEARTRTARLEQDAHIHEALLAEAHAAQEQRRVALADCQEQLADAQAQLQCARTRQEELRLELVNQHERLSAEREETKTQRRSIARELKAQHAARLAEFEQRKTELETLAASRHTQLEAQLAAANAEMSQCRQQLADMRKSLDDRSEELTQTLKTTNASKAETDELRASLQKTQAEAGRAADALSQAEMAGGNHHEQLVKLRNDCENLTRHLAAAESKLKEFSETERSSGKQEDLQRRFEMAVEELREMKTAHAQLEAKLAKTRGDSSGSGRDGNTGMDWAAQKQRLLALLEADDDDDDEAVAERNSVEGTIRITDQIVAQKDREIAELNHLLEEQSKSLGPVVANAAAMADVLGRDELIRQEREKLRQVQAEWREKIGKAEIDISMERAKIARDRADLEEKMRCYQREQASHAIEDPQADSQGKPVRGRWLARLGLKELGE